MIDTYVTKSVKYPIITQKKMLDVDLVFPILSGKTKIKIKAM